MCGDPCERPSISNEELQSTNEELTTSREEMQSMNEELKTLNAELTSKVEELSRTSADMKNLLDSTEIATVFLDAALNVRRFTSRVTSIFRVIPGNVGRPSATSPLLSSTRSSPPTPARRCGPWPSTKSRRPPKTATGTRCASCPIGRWKTASTGS